MTSTKTKIVATIGPATSSREKLKALIEAGVNVCRINMSHGSHEIHAEVIEHVRNINQELRSNVAILADLQGPKIRIGELSEEQFELKDGDEIVITTEKIKGVAGRFPIQYEEFPKDVNHGELVLVDDGKIQLKVIESDGAANVKLKVIHGGPLKPKKGVNLPNTVISQPCLTEKDLKDLAFALDNNVSWVGLSFVREGNDIDELRAIIDEGNKDAKIIAKIEKPEAIDNIDEIISKTDAVMVARGDLGVEVPAEKVPLIQKEIVQKCLVESKPTIIATQMMESMITSITPTRAEVNDVANAVLDGADAVMLSGETSVGDFPVEVIKNMRRILKHTETAPQIYFKDYIPERDDDRFLTDVICRNASTLAKESEATAIATMTFSGYSAREISSYRPRANVFVFTSNYRILNQLSLIWGVQGFYYDKFVSTDQTIKDIKHILKKAGWVKSGELMLNVASMPIAEKGQTNMLKLSSVD